MKDSVVESQKPFLKWAGNKYTIRQSIQAILDDFPDTTRLIEPFAGSGAVFLNTQYPQYLLCDGNVDLIMLYQTLASEGPSFIDWCRSFFTPENNDQDRFYSLRETFNTTADSWLKSALFVYLNRHCFNGLCRYNSKGQFNVPFGQYRQPYFPEKEMLAFHQKAQQDVTFEHADFLIAMAQAKAGDVVYCDPPYVPLSPTASFTSYQQTGFNLTQQSQLAQMAETLSERGVVVLISNHDTPFTREAYQSAKLTSLEVRRTISCQGDKRSKAPELLALFTHKQEGKLPEKVKTLIS